VAEDPRIPAIPDIHGHAKGEHRPFAEERPIAYSARMLFLWFYHACRRSSPRFLMVSDHINFLTFEDPGAVNAVRRALKLAEAGDLYGAAETADVDVAVAAVVSEGVRRGMRFSIGAEVDTDPRARPDAQNIVDAMRPDGLIRSVHFLTIDHPEKGADWPWPFDNEEFVSLFDTVGVERTWEMYVSKLVDEIEKLPGHIVGHFFAPAKFGHWPDSKKLAAYEDRVLEACHRRGMAIEFNTRVLYREPPHANHPQDQRRRYLDAYRRFLKKAKSLGVPVAIGSDAHSPKDQGAGFDVVLQLLDECGINELAFPINGRLRKVALRATREHIERVRHRPERPAVPGSSISGLGRAELGLPEVSESVRTPRQGGPRAARTASPKRSSEQSSSKRKQPAKKAGAKRTTQKRVAPKKPARKAVSKRARVKKTVRTKATKAAPHKRVTSKPAKKRARKRKVSVRRTAKAKKLSRKRPPTKAAKKRRRR
jgi:HisJ family histidinol phosphate phosphatase